MKRFSYCCDVSAKVGFNEIDLFEQKEHPHEKPARLIIQGQGFSIKTSSSSSSLSYHPSLVRNITGSRSNPPPLSSYVLDEVQSRQRSTRRPFHGGPELKWNQDLHATTTTIPTTEATTSGARTDLIPFRRRRTLPDTNGPTCSVCPFVIRRPESLDERLVESACRPGGHAPPSPQLPQYWLSYTYENGNDDGRPFGSGGGRLVQKGNKKKASIETIRRPWKLNGVLLSFPSFYTRAQSLAGGPPAPPAAKTSEGTTK
jgi:hypothetical protein